MWLTVIESTVHHGRSVRWLVTSHSQSGSGKTNAAAQFTAPPLPFQSRIPAHRIVPPTFRLGCSLSRPFLFSPGPQPIGWCYPHSGSVVPSQLPLSRDSLPTRDSLASLTGGCKGSSRTQQPASWGIQCPALALSASRAGRK